MSNVRDLGFFRLLGSAAIHGSRLLQRRAGAAIAAGGARGVEIRRIDLRIELAEAGFRILADYLLWTRDPSDPRPIHFDLTDSQVTLERLRTGDSGKGKILSVFNNSPPPVVSIAEANWDSHNEMLVGMSLSWKYDDRDRWTSIPCVIAPDTLPCLLRAPGDSMRDTITRPIVRVLSMPRSPGLRLGGIPMPGYSTGREVPLIQGVLVATGRILTSRAGFDVVATAGLGAELGVDSSNRLADALGTAVDFLGREMDYPINARCVAKTGLERVGKWNAPAGACMDFGKEAMVAGNRRPVDPTYYVGVNAAGIWWGGGVRVHGRYGMEIDSGIRIALAALWLRHEGGPSAIAPVLANLDRNQRRGHVRDWPRIVTSGVRPSVAAKTAWSVYSLIEADERGTLDSLGSIAREYWGRSVSSEVVESCFRTRQLDLRLS